MAIALSLLPVSWNKRVVISFASSSERGAGYSDLKNLAKQSRTIVFGLATTTEELVGCMELTLAPSDCP
jgi:hypothetical protein